MSGEFRGVAYSPQYVDSTSGSSVPIQMPADIVAGDWLIVSGDGYNLHVAEHPAGWTAINGSRSISVKIADGSEAGAVINWVSTDTTSLDPFGTSPNPRAAVFAAFSYRFPIAPTAGGGLGPSSACHPFTRRFVPPGGSPDFVSPIDSASYYATGFGGTVANPGEFRFLAVAAQAGVTVSGPQAIASSIDWYSSDPITDRSGVHSEPWSGDPNSFDDPVSWSWADQFYLTTPAHDPATHVIAAGGAGINFLMEGFVLDFPSVPTAPYWGILTRPG